jgi:hypothetical protein
MMGERRVIQEALFYASSSSGRFARSTGSSTFLRFGGILKPGSKRCSTPRAGS